MKGHSKRVPNKNIRDFVGRPLYHWVTESLLNSKYIKEIYVNTDSELIIKDIRKNFPTLKIIKRPENLIGDDVSMNKLNAYDLSQIDNEYFLLTFANSPLLSTKTFNKAIETFFNKKCDSLFGVSKHQLWFYDDKGEPINHNPNELLKTQDVTPLYEDNSTFYIFSKKSFIENDNNRIGKNPFMFIVRKIEAFHIDTWDDWEVAEAIKKSTIDENKTKNKKL